MKNTTHRHLAGLFLLALFCASRSEAEVVILGTRVIYPYQLAAWRLRGHLRSDRGDLWTRAANYHSRTPRHNARYRAQLMHKAWRWNQWLGRQFTTHRVDDVTTHRHGETGVADVPDSGDAA